MKERDAPIPMVINEVRCNYTRMLSSKAIMCISVVKKNACLSWFKMKQCRVNSNIATNQPFQKVMYRLLV
jgi:hypothetical protein